MNQPNTPPHPPQIFDFIHYIASQKGQYERNTLYCIHPYLTGS
jgi:hypothetical protein